MQEETGRTEIFTLLKHTTLINRLAREFSELPSEISGGPSLYLRSAFFPDGINSWLPFSLASHFLEEVGHFFKHPIRFIKDAFSSDAIIFGFIIPPTYAVEDFSPNVLLHEKRKIKRSPWLRPLLAVSGVFHLAFISFLIYIWIQQFIAPFSNITVVNKTYRQYDEKLIAVMPPRQPKLQARSLEKTLSLDEIRERDRKRKEEAEQRKREEEERKKREEEDRAKAELIAKEKAEQEAKEKAEQEAKDKAANSKPEDAKKTGSGIELNETAIKDIVGKVYALYNAGFIKVDVKNMKLILTFKIEGDGTVSNIKVVQSSGNNYVDRQAKDVLWTLGESHIFGATSKLTSTSIALELTENYSRLTIVGFAPNPDDANTMAKGLNFLLFALRARKNSSAELTELLSQMKVRNTGNRVEANLTLSSDRAGELLKNKFGNNAQPPN